MKPCGISSPVSSLMFMTFSLIVLPNVANALECSCQSTYEGLSFTDHARREERQPMRRYDIIRFSDAGCMNGQSTCTTDDIDAGDGYEPRCLFVTTQSPKRKTFRDCVMHKQFDQDDTKCNDFSGKYEIFCKTNKCNHDPNCPPKISRKPKEDKTSVVNPQKSISKDHVEVDQSETGDSATPKKSVSLFRTLSWSIGLLVLLQLAF